MSRSFLTWILAFPLAACAAEEKRPRYDPEPGIQIVSFDPARETTWAWSHERGLLCRGPGDREWMAARGPDWVRPVRDLPTLRFGRTRFAMITGDTITFGVAEPRALRAISRLELPGIPTEFHFNSEDADLLLVETTVGLWLVDLETWKRERLRHGAPYSPSLYYDPKTRTLVSREGGRMVYFRPP